MPSIWQNVFELWKDNHLKQLCKSSPSDRKQERQKGKQIHQACQSDNKSRKGSDEVIDTVMDIVTKLETINSQ